MAKTKQKTHSGLRKRVKVSARGKVRYRKSFTGHLMTSKSGRRKQRLRRKGELLGTVAKSARRALGVD